MMIVGSLSACFFTLVSMLTDDHCFILDYTEDNKTVAGVPQLYPEGLVPILDTCLFGEIQNAAVDLDLYTQVVSLTELQNSSEAFLTASTDIAWNDAAWADYITQIETWEAFPSTLEFTDSSLTQPAEQLVKINDRVDVKRDVSLSDICNGMFDKVVDDVSECTNPDWQIIPAQETDAKIYEGQETCYSVVEQTLEFTQERYTEEAGSDTQYACTDARLLLQQYKDYQNSVYNAIGGGQTDGVDSLMTEVKTSVTENMEQVQSTSQLLLENDMQTEMQAFADAYIYQWSKYGEGFSIENNLDCSDILTSYDNYKEPLCNSVKKGFIELLALRVISLPLEIGLCILGIRFVIRNKVDVPQYQ